MLDDYDLRLRGLFFGLKNFTLSRRISFVCQIVHATVAFFIGYGVVALFSPSIASLNFSVSDSTILIAMPTITATIFRIPLSVLTVRFGTRYVLAFTQLIGLIGIFMLVFVVQFSKSFGALIVCGLVTGVAGEKKKQNAYQKREKF